MAHYNSIVVGSGISGMTMSLILALNGKKVLLLEKAPLIGGSMSRFYREGVPFDTGFHFTGGLQQGGMLHDILRVLGIADMIEPDFLAEDKATTFMIESDDRSYDFPYGIGRIKKRLEGYFPGESSAIDSYFSRVRDVCDKTQSMNLRRMPSRHESLKEDYISLQEALDSMTTNLTLKALLSGFAICYGVKPNEISFANHSRMSIGLYESIARVRNGGNAFIKAFKARFKNLDVDVRTGSFIKELVGIEDRRANRFLLDDGQEVTADSCVFTIHPKEILKILPEQQTSRAFRERVGSFEPSTGFFSVFATLPSDFDEPDFDRSLAAIMPEPDINMMFDPAEDSSALILIKSIEQMAGGEPCKVLSTFEATGVGQLDRWAHSTIGNRPEGYLDYKARKVERTLSHIYERFPRYRGKLKVLDSASVLTYRDYLHSFDGSAYGVKQKLGQFNLRGELPVRNIYVAGQSSLLPGIIGAMMSSFIVARTLLDKETFGAFIERGLGA